MPKFQPGQSGNPSGRPRQRVDFDRAARREAKRSLKTMVELRDNPKISPAVRLDASEGILDRAWGRPIAPSEGTLNVNGTVLHVVTGLSRRPSDPILDATAAKTDPRAIEMPYTPEPASADSATTQQALPEPPDDMPHSARDQYR
jgi:hypothetical protein